MPDWLDKTCVNDLIDLGVITRVSASSSDCEHSVTDFGRDVLTCSTDVHLGILETVCSRLDLAWHGRIASAYVQTARDIFLRSDLQKTCGLLSAQVACGHQAGFRAEGGVHGEGTCPKSTLLTAVSIYLKSVSEDSLLDGELFRTQWLRHMHRNVTVDRSGRQAEVLSATMARDLLATANWEEGVHIYIYISIYIHI